MPILGDRDVDVEVTIEPELTLGKLTHVWALGVGSDRSLGRPKEWNGESSVFDNFAFKFSIWLSGLPGDAERFQEESASMGQPIMWDHPVLRSVFEMWRLICKKCKPDTATRKVCLLQRVIDDQLTPEADFGDWFLRWLDLV